MNKFALLAAAALTAGTFGLAAIAQDNNTTEFDDVDGNKDGMITYEEALVVSSTLTQAQFDQADADGNGSLDEAELISLMTLATPENDGNESSSAATSSTVDDASSSTSQ
jgi:hypothetical protein